MKFKLILASALMMVTSLFAQSSPFPTFNPTSATVNYDKATDTLVALAPVTVTAGANSFTYSVFVPVEFSSVVVYSPMVGFLPAGGSGTLQLGINAQSLNMGTYNIPVNFIQNSPNLVTAFNITLNVTDSRTFILPNANDRQIPHIAAGDVWKTKLRLVNTTSSSSVSEIRFYNAQGVSETFSVNGFLTNYVPSITIPAKGFVDLTLDNGTGLKTGTAAIKPLLGSVPSVNVIYLNTASVHESAVEIKQPNRSSMTMLFNNIGRNSTGIAVSNALNYDQELTFEFFDDQGVSLVPSSTAVAKVRVPPNGQYTVTINNTWPFTAGRSGSIRITGSQAALFGFGLQFDLDRGVFYTQPAF